MTLTPNTPWEWFVAIYSILFAVKTLEQILIFTSNYKDPRNDRNHT